MVSVQISSAKFICTNGHTFVQMTSFQEHPHFYVESLHAPLLHICLQSVLTGVHDSMKSDVTIIRLSNLGQSVLLSTTVLTLTHYYLETYKRVIG